MKTIVSAALNNLKWEKTFVSLLPGDPITDNYTRQVRGACYSFTQPQTFPSPSLVILSLSVCKLLNISEEMTKSQEFLSIFTGQAQVSDIKPWSCCYGGHQFGFWAGQLGDGRAITIGELRAEDNKLYDVQLKGSGRTPYSRQGDGKAVLRSCIREYLASEAMYYLGVPTTRALGVFLTGEKVIRDILYDGNPAPEKGAMLCRVAESLVRFGNFEILNSNKKHEVSKELLNYVIERNFPELMDIEEPERYFKWLETVVGSTAKLIAQWQGVGFVHGVLNTDNMSVLGETIDYGPYGFMEEFEGDWTPNTTDNDTKRYTYANQPDIGLWNLAMLGNALMPLLEDGKRVGETLKKYKGIYREHYIAVFKKKIGLVSTDSEQSEELIQSIMSLIGLCKLDMAIFFRKFADFNVFEFEEQKYDAFLDSISDSMYSIHAIEPFLNRWGDFLTQYKKALVAESSSFLHRKTVMDSSNPKYILRNWQLQECINQAEEGKYEMLKELDAMVRTPFDEKPEFDKYFKKRPDWAKRLPGYSMLSCSS